MARSHHIYNPLNGQRGSAAIMFALFLPVLLGFTALAIDLARLNLIKVELQNAADAAALAGARSLIDAGGDPYNWSAATAKALELATSNNANGGNPIPGDSVTIETGYWNLQNSSFSTGSVAPLAGGYAAVRVTIGIENVNLFFAPFLGIDESDVQASAVAAIPTPGGGTGMFPFAISQCILDQLWDSDTNTPKLDPATGKPYIFEIGTPYPSTSCYTGQWTTFQEDDNSASYVRDLIEGDVIPPPTISIGEDTWIQPGVKASNYDYVDEGIDVSVVVVNDVNTHSEQPVVAIAGFHISEVDKHGSHSSVKGHLIDPKVFPGLTPGDGTGTPYGAYTPPILVQ
ncbi:MAG: hypothetical protein JW764_07975 [Chlorobiaceae bacterium]|nr:hypothetical protein [Chlorobiaceae bacterium]